LDLNQSSLRRDGWSALFPAFVVLAAFVVWISSLSLPLAVASHFDAAGQANGFMPRAAYVWFMVGLIVALPLLIVYLPNWLLRRAGGAINLPHKTYWLAPARREETVDYLCSTSYRFGFLTVGFIAYVHLLVVRANRATPPHLDSVWFVGGLVAFVLVSLAVAIALFRRFGRVPQQ
jgi:Protein of unknown function (DUF1648)